MYEHALSLEVLVVFDETAEGERAPGFLSRSGSMQPQHRTVKP